MKRHNGLISLVFFVFWLISFPMGGRLLTGYDQQDLLLFFLIPHTVSLFLMGRFVQPKSFKKIALTGITGTAVLTIVFPFLKGLEPFLLVFLGVASAPLVIKTLFLVRNADVPLFSAGAGLGLGNLLVFVFQRWSIPVSADFFVISLCLLPIAILDFNEGEVSGSRRLRRYLPVFFVFYMTGGLLYSFIMPQYAPAAFSLGSELLFYIVPAAGGVWLAKKDIDIPLGLGIVFSALAFSLVHYQNPLSANLSMFSAQASFAFMDLFLVCLLIACADSLKSFGYGMGVMCLGILMGHLAGTYFEDAKIMAITFGNMVLVFSVLLLYFTDRKKGAEDEQQAALPTPPNHSNGEINGIFPRRLSEKEKAVAELVVSGKTYREVASSLNISESSVKTYMKRTYEKMGVSGKKTLREKLLNSFQID